MRVLVIDGQGGKIGSAVVQGLIARGCGCEVWAVGTNTVATAAMRREGAQEAATGENPVKVCAAQADVIVGPVGIIAADSLMGEITPAMAQAVSMSRAQKLLIPVNRCRIRVVGVREMSMGDSIACAVDEICRMAAGGE